MRLQWTGYYHDLEAMNDFLFVLLEEQKDTNFE